MPANRWRRLVLVLFLVGAVAHVVFWYLPRLRQVAFDGSVGTGEAAELLLDDAHPVRLWVAFPHQNLAELDRALGGLDAYLADLAAQLDSEAPELPRFGPFRIPPAKALSAAYDPESGSLTVVAEIYPVIAWIARAAGKLTGNRWLAGGRLDEKEWQQEVQWRRGSWRFERTAASGSRRAASSLATPASADGPNSGRPTFPERVAALGVSRLPHELLPTGGYSLRYDTSSEDWIVETAGVAATPFSPLETQDLPPAMVASGTGFGDRQPGGLVLFGGQLVADAGVLSLPGAATFRLAESGGVGRSGWRIPGHKMLSRLGWDPLEGNLGRWTVAALERNSLERTLNGSEVYRALLDEAVETRLRLVARVDLEVASDHLGGLAGAVEQVPVIGERQARPWRRLERLMAPFATGYVLEVQVRADQLSARLVQ